ncbi:diguanylate cyclase/phosphodiesterase (GGDEF & EAL domains) with PAS/PAC sensor(s) [Oxalobacteraceae bacterium IMCC9480]|nr:diguanylate cyclase/phosphodiesterase (GGDEF & EAL domains) with PAS/PAC sensor(s) [Oxalobacteraceae bacterium IMCC9480]
MSMDDFGTGYSSLSHLRKLPLQCLKIDQSFIRSMLDDSNAEKLTQAILAMGLALKMEVVAEGIETLDQMTWLKNHGCQIGQGYLFSRPVRADVLHQVVEEIERRFLSVTVSPESLVLAG